MKYTS